MSEHGESSILQRCLSYADKFKSSNNLDEILLASTNYINEDLNHTRKDNIKEFARGEVLIRVGANDYSAKVIVGFTAGKQMLLYDIVDFAPTNIATKKRTHQDFGESRTPRKDVFSNITVTQKSPSVNSILSENPKKITTESKNTAENSGVKRQNSIENKAAYGTAQTKLTKEYRAAVDRVLNMQDTTADNLVIGYTPELMKDMGMPALPFVIGTGHVYSAAKTEAEARKDGNYRKGVHYHGLGDTVVKNIYEQLQDPVMIIAAKDVNGNASPLRSTHSVVAIVDIGTANNSLLLPVEITAERTVDGQQMDANVLSSVYDRNVKNLIKEAIALENSGDVGIYYAKKEAAALIPAGVQFPVRIQKAIASNPIVRSFDEKVNRKISDVTQSLQFKRWFGDWQNHPENASKIVNADGTPKVVYHQTDADFTVFNTDNQRAGKLDTDTPTGMFFKPTDQNIGINGTKQMPVYLNARNILELKNRDEAHRYWMQNVPGYAKLQAQYDAVDTKYNKRYEEAENISDEWYDKNYDDLVSGKISDEEALRVMDEPLDKILKEWKSKTEPIAIKQKQLITDFIKNSSYDGIHLSYDGRRNGVDVETFIVFDPTQIKSATDNIGTFDGTNPDIRFQRKLPDVQEKLKKMSGSDDIDDVKRMAYGLADDFMKYAKAARLEMTETRGLMPQSTRVSEIVAKYNDYRKTGISNKQLESDITDIFTDYMNGVGSSGTLFNYITDTIMKRELNSYEVIGDETFKAVRAYTDGGKFKVSDATVGSLVDTFGSLGEINGILRENYGFTIAKETDARAENRAVWAPVGAQLAEEAGHVFDGTDNSYTSKYTTENGYVTSRKVYQCESCEGCPYRNECHTSKYDRRICVSHKMTEQNQKATELITTDEGILLRMNRSIQVGCRR